MRLLVLYVVAATRKLGGAARRMEHANNGTVCTPRRRFEQAQRRATAIAKHVDARAGATRSEEAAPVGDDGSPLLRHASRGAPSPTPSPRVDHGRARVPLVIACAIRICRGGVFPGCFLPSGRRPCFVGSLRSPTRVAAPAFLLEVAFSCGLGTLGTGGSCWVAPRASWTALFCLLVSYS